jgi:hypothetical protein
MVIGALWGMPRGAGDWSSDLTEFRMYVLMKSAICAGVAV